MKFVQSSKFKGESLKAKSTPAQRSLHSLWYLLLVPLVVVSQHTPKVSATVDTTAIKIGEQIQYHLTVETDSTTQVHFPEGQTFSPLETVEALPVDTMTKGNQRILQRLYALTQFDSGAYTIPPQRIAINGQPFFTDTFRIQVAGVAVDTTQQKLYDIKPLLEVEKEATSLWKFLPWLLLGLLLVGGTIYWFLFRKKPMAEVEKEALLPPYDRALLELQKLENAKYLLQDEYKKYYSELTTIIRTYLEKDLQIAALESTTAQLITELEIRRYAGKLNIKRETLTQFQNLLQTADLVKFAKSKPTPIAAEQDRKTVEQIITKTHKALPVSIQEKLQQSEAYIAARAQKQKRRNRYWALGIVVGLLLLGGLGSITYFGFKHIRDTLLGHPTKELLQGEWITSAYGFPPVVLATPKVLLRQDVPLPPEAKANIKAMQTFAYGSYLGTFAIATSSVTYKNPIDPNFAVATESTLTTFERLGLKNITTKQEEFITKSGIQGVKTYGTGTFKNPDNNTSKKIQYTLLSFGGKGFMQQVVITWEKGDTYAEQIAARVLNSVEVKTQI